MDRLALPPAPSQHLTDNAKPTSADLSGEWQILEVEDDKRYKATLDKNGHGLYTQGWSKRPGVSPAQPWRGSTELAEVSDASFRSQGPPRISLLV